MSSVCKRYRTIKTLVIKADGFAPASTTCSPPGKKTAPASDADPAVVFIEITFAGPQPSENCGALLCLLLGGDSVQAWPVALPRGRKRKNTAVSLPAAAVEAADEDAVSEGKLMRIQAVDQNKFRLRFLWQNSRIRRH